MNCKDCGLIMTEKMINHHDKEARFPEHTNRCCDCADELLGMPEENRIRPRPKENKGM